MSNLDYFSRGLIKAFERQRAMQQQVNVVSDDRDSTITTNTIIKTTTDTSITKFSDRLNQTIIVKEMISLIKQRKMK